MVLQESEPRLCRELGEERCGGLWWWPYGGDGERGGGWFATVYRVLGVWSTQRKEKECAKNFEVCFVLSS